MSGITDAGQAARAAIAAAQQLHETRLVADIHTQFPEVTDLGWRDANHGAAGISREYTGRWHGLVFEFSRQSTDGQVRGHLMRHCHGCDALVSASETSIIRADELYDEDADELAERASDTDECFSCVWLRDAQADAHVSVSLSAKWRFKQSHGATVAEVLARTR